jgi:hypothetical protein
MITPWIRLSPAGYATDMPRSAVKWIKLASFIISIF